MKFEPGISFSQPNSPILLWTLSQLSLEPSLSPWHSLLWACPSHFLKKWEPDFQCAGSLSPGPGSFLKRRLVWKTNKRSLCSLCKRSRQVHWCKFILGPSPEWEQGFWIWTKGLIWVEGNSEPKFQSIESSWVLSSLQTRRATVRSEPLDYLPSRPASLSTKTPIWPPKITVPIFWPLPSAALMEHHMEWHFGVRGPRGQILW